MSSDQTEPLLPNASQGEQGIDLLAVLVAVVLEWRIILGCTFVVLLVSIYGIFSLKSQFVSDAKILPTNSRGENDAFASLIWGQRGPGALYVGMLKSRSVLDSVVEHTGLMQALQIKDKQAAREVLAGKTTISEGGDSLITIEVKDVDAQRSTQLTNAYLDSLQELNERIAVRENQQTRNFFELQLREERELLEEAEVALARTQKSTGLVDPAAQTQFGLGAIQNIRAQILTLQVQLAALLQKETDQAPDVQSLRSQVRQLQSEEYQMESTASAPVGAPPSAAVMPQKNLDYQRALRAVKEHETIVQSLASQFESARLSEAAGRSAFQVVDRAVVPERKSWPPRRQLLILAAVLSLLVGLFAAGIKMFIRRLIEDPVSRGHLSRLHLVRRST